MSFIIKRGPFSQAGIHADDVTQRGYEFILLRLIAGMILPTRAVTSRLPSLRWQESMRELYTSSTPITMTDDPEIGFTEEFLTQEQTRWARWTFVFNRAQENLEWKAIRRRVRSDGAVRRLQETL
jgi:hypothetical protein